MVDPLLEVGPGCHRKGGVRLGTDEISKENEEPMSAMGNNKSLPIFVQPMFVLMLFAALARAQTVGPITSTDSADKPASSRGETEQSAATTSLTAKQAGGFSNLRPNDHWRLDLRTGKEKTAKSTFDGRSSAVSNITAWSESELQDPQDAKPAAHAASNGTNPAELITRVEVKYQYQHFASGDLHGIAIIRADYAFKPTVAFRMDLPILHFNSKTPGLRSESGIGDIVTSMTFVKMFSRRFVGAVVPRVDFPTATHDSLGSGKYAFKPVVAGVTPLAKGLAFVGVLEYRVSFAGNQNRADINELSLKPILLKSFFEGPLKGYYVNPQVEVIVDFENNNRATFQLAANAGKVLSKNVVVFVVPTIHVAGTKRESFKLEVGFRYLFR